MTTDTMYLVTRLGALAVFITFAPMPLLTAQDSQVKHEALKQFLGLSDSELSRLQVERTRSSVTLTDFQKGQLEEAAGVLRHAWVYEAVSLGLVSAQQWPGSILCYDEKSYLGLGLSGAQFDKLRKLQGEPKALRLGVLTDAQLKRLASYEAQLELVNQAIDLGLISKPTHGEPLCH